MHTLEEFYTFYKENFANSNSELLSQLNSYRKKFFQNILIALLLLGIFPTGWIIAIESGFDFDSASSFVQIIAVVVNVILFSAFLFFLGQASIAQKKHQSVFKDKVIRKIIEFIDPSLKYSPNKYIEESIFRKIDFFPSKIISKYSGDDYVEGTIGKTKIRFCDLNVEEKVNTGKSSYDRPFFRGLFIMADFNKNFNGRTYCMPDINDRSYRRLLIFGEAKYTSFGELVKLENIKFEKYFAVFSTDQIEARYILSTSLMERLVNLREKIMREIYVCFADSSIYMAIPFNRDLFEPNILQKSIKYELLREYYEILYNTIGIVEELNLNTRIWTKQ